MTDWVNIANSAVAPKAPVTSELVTALRDNTVVSTWEFYETVYDAALDGAVSVIETSNFQDGWEYGFIVDGLTSTLGGTQYLFVGFYDENSLSWSYRLFAAQSGSTSPFQKRFAAINLPRVAADRFQIYGFTDSSGESIIYGAGDNVVIGKLSFSWSSSASFDTPDGSSDSGTIKLYRRKENISDA